MKTSASISKIIPALLKAQKAMGGAVKDSKNPYFKSNYADYGSVLEASKAPLNDNGILVLQPHTFHDGKNFVETVLSLEDQWVSSETEIVCAKPNDPQALGSAITYARRYGLQSFLSMPTEDDDGEKAMVRAPKALPSKTETATVAAKAETPKAAPAQPKIGAAPVATPAAAAPATTSAPTGAETPKKPSFKDKIAAKPKAAPATNGANGFG